MEMTKLDPVEKKRTYYFPDGNKIEIENVSEFLYRESGRHRLKTLENKLYIIQNGWFYIEIEANDFTI